MWELVTVLTDTTITGGLLETLSQAQVEVLVLTHYSYHGQYGSVGECNQNLKGFVQYNVEANGWSIVEKTTNAFTNSIGAIMEAGKWSLTVNCTFDSAAAHNGW